MRIHLLPFTLLFSLVAMTLFMGFLMWLWEDTTELIGFNVKTSYARKNITKTDIISFILMLLFSSVVITPFSLVVLNLALNKVTIVEEVNGELTMRKERYFNHIKTYNQNNEPVNVRIKLFGKNYIYNNTDNYLKTVLVHYGHGASTPNTKHLEPHTVYIEKHVPSYLNSSPTTIRSKGVTADRLVIMKE